jgi:hypothetical protein
MHTPRCIRPDAYALMHMLSEYEPATACTPTHLYTCSLSMYALTADGMNACPSGTSKHVIIYNQLIRTIGNIEWPPFWDQNPHALPLVSLAILSLGTSASCTAVIPACLWLRNFDLVTWLALIGNRHRCLTASYRPPSFLMHRQSPPLLDIRPIIPFSPSAITCPVHLNKVGSLHHTSFFSPRSFMACSSSSKTRSEQAREKG